jgi:cytochrome c553
MKSKLIAVLLLLSSLSLSADESRALEQFENKVRPILAANCFACHSKTAVAGLRLDSREAMLKGAAHGPVLIPGKPEESLLMKVLHHDPSIGIKGMPMGNKLKPEEMAAISDWIKNGAPWPVAAPIVSQKNESPDHVTADQKNWWSFRKLNKPALPTLKDAAWMKSNIDRLLAARWEKEGVVPVKLADRRTLIRRVTLDLTGVPPTTEEVEAFIADKSPNAYSNLVDRLLASPKYGERWGRLWLDVVRFGEDDTRGLAMSGKGHEPYQYAYLFRDWVIQAHNEDVPFDKFVKAHLAADQMAEADRVKMLPALGFLGQGPWYYDLTEPPVARADERHERVDTTTRAFLGLTVGCARCHDHKYDPISMRDYYGLAGIFNASNYHEYPMVPKKTADDWLAKEKKIKEQEKLLGDFQRTASEQLAMVLARKTSQYMLAAWKVTGEPKVPIDQVTNDMKLDRELLERWIKFLAKPPAFYSFLKPWQEMMKTGGKEPQAKKLAGEFQKLLFDVVAEQSNNKKSNEKLLIKADVSDPDEIKSIPLPNGFKSFFDQHQLELKVLDRERMNLLQDVFYREMTDEQNNMMRRSRPGLLVFRGHGLMRQLSPEWKDHIDGVKKELDAAIAELGDKFPYVHGVKDVEKLEPFKIHLRGNVYSQGDVAPRSFPLVLTEGEKRETYEKDSGRAELASRMATHPLAARVIVNRLWRGHFGSGIVETPSNFGVSGEKPQHPELLEYLAATFVENGYSMKKLHKEIVLSNVYQLSSDANPANNQKDPANRLYWRANKNRMDAEQVRDSMLSISGLMDPKMFGPSSEFKDDFARRSVYGKVSRFRLDTYLQLFDFPNPNLSAEKRYVTNVPLQRLFFLNSDFVYLQAKEIAKKVKLETTEDGKIRKLYRMLYFRDPDADEIKAGHEYLAAEEKAIEDAKKPAEKKSEVKAVEVEQVGGAADGARPPETNSATKPAAQPAAKPASEAASSTNTSTPAANQAPEAPNKSRAEKQMEKDAERDMMPKPASDEDEEEEEDGPPPSAKSDSPAPKKIKQKHDAWTQYVRVLLSSSEFTFIE